MNTNSIRGLIISCLVLCGSLSVSAYEFDVIITNTREQIQCFIMLIHGVFASISYSYCDCVILVLCKNDKYLHQFF